MMRLIGRAMVITGAATLFAAALLTVGHAPAVDAQSAEVFTGRITARLLADDSIEFGWETASGIRVLPTLRFLTETSPTGRWLSSSDVIADGVNIGKINVRDEDGRVEFGLTPRDGSRILPRARYFPDEAEVGEWLVSPSITFTLGQPTVAQMEADILRTLFGDERGRSSGNDWGCPFTAANGATCLSRSFYEGRQAYADQRATYRWNAYVGGHGGWDASHPDRNKEFRSLTDGTVILAGTDLRANPRSCNDIAVYDRSGGITTIYLHAEDVRVKQGQRVEVGTLLGTEGTSCAPGAEHVHIEIRRGRPDVAQGGNGPRIYARGAGQQPGHQLPCADVGIDPIPYLYRSATGRSVPDSSGWQRCDDGTPPLDPVLIRVEGTEDVYEVRGSYRRLIIAGGIINAVPQFQWDAIRDVSQAEMNRYQVSRLVRLPNDGGKVYRVESAGADSAILRHIPDAAAFNRAGCEWDAVYDITEQEASFSGYSKGRAMPSSGWSC